MELGFICKWERRREATWSGTPYGLYKELGKIYNIYDVNSGHYVPDLWSFLCRVKYKLDAINGKTGVTDMALFHIYAVRHRIRKLLRGKNIPVLLFEEILDAYPGKKYIYQDLYSGFVKRLVDDEPIVFDFRVSTLQQEIHL